MLIVDDHPVVIDGVRRALASQPTFEVVGEAADRDSAIREVEELQPDIVLLDLCLDGLFVPDLCRILVSVAPEARIVLHTAFHVHEPLKACLEAGAFGVVFKDGRDLVRALHSVAVGKVFIQQLTSGSRHPSGVGSEALDPLSPREYDVLCALALGRSTREIAQTLHLTVNTVRSYIKSLLAKLHANSRVEVLAVARRHHLL